MNLATIRPLWCCNQVQNFQDFKNKTANKLMFLLYVFCIFKWYRGMPTAFLLTKEKLPTWTWCFLEGRCICFIILNFDLTNLILFWNVQNIEFVNVLLKHFLTITSKYSTSGKTKWSTLPSSTELDGLLNYLMMLYK